eukprot:UN05837
MVHFATQHPKLEIDLHAEFLLRQIQVLHSSTTASNKEMAMIQHL